jgi:splicing factor U2AF subunit
MGVRAGLMPGVQPPSQQATRHARRVYVGGLPPTGNEQNIATFFSNALAAIGGTTAGPGARLCARCQLFRYPS